MQTTGGTSLSPVDSDASGREGAGADRRDGGSATQGNRLIGLFLTVALFVYLVDLFSKIVVVTTLSDRGPVTLLGGFVTLQLTRNSGAAFSFGTGYTVLLSVLAIGVAVAVVRLSSRLGSSAWAVALGLLLGGACGNLTDRLFRAPGPFRGRVVDFVELPNWPIFNAADSAIVLGACLIVLQSVRGVRLDGSHS